MAAHNGRFDEGVLRRAGFDPASWDPDAERAARASVVEVPAGHLVPAIRPHALARSVEALFAYRPATVLPSIEAPIVALLSSDPEGREALPAAQAALAKAFPDALADGRLKISTRDCLRLCTRDPGVRREPAGDGYAVSC